MKTLTGLWPTLESMSVPATVLADWEQLLSGDYAAVLPWLNLTREVADTYPCIHPRPCGCAHEVVAHSVKNIKAACRCKPAECASFSVEPTDLLVYELECRRFFNAIGKALGFEATADTGAPVAGAAKIRFVGIYPRTHSPVYFAFCPTDDLMLGNVSGLIQAQPEPFVLLAASRRNLFVRAENLLQRQRSVFIPVADFLTLGGKGTFKATSSLQPMLDRFAAGCVPHGPDVLRVVERIDRNIGAVALNQYELRKENEELRQLNKDGYFNFAVRVNGKDFLAFAVIMALGNRKAAADHLKIPHRTFYNRVDQWAKRGKDYQLMVRYMDWRKRSSRHLKVELTPSLQSGESGDQPENPDTIADVLEEVKAADNKSYPALLAEVFQALQRQNSGNWMKVRQDLLETIKEDVMQ